LTSHNLQDGGFIHYNVTERGGTGNGLATPLTDDHDLEVGVPALQTEEMSTLETSHGVSVVG